MWIAKGDLAMTRISWRDRIVIDPEIHHGEPCIRGTRVPVAIVIGSFADGMTVDEIINQYPQLSPEDIRAALAYAAEVMRQEIILPLSA
jgi:uncharacterized protein (DUF433 family)